MKRHRRSSQSLAGILMLAACSLLVTPGKAFAQDEAWVDSFTADDVPVTASVAVPASPIAPAPARRWFAVALNNLQGLFRLNAPIARASQRPVTRMGYHPLSNKPAYVTRSVLRANTNTATTHLQCMGGAQSGNPDQDILVMVEIYVGSERVTFSSGWGYRPSARAEIDVQTVDYDRPLACYATAPGSWAQATGTLLADCGDERTTLIREYRAHNVTWRPTCNEMQSIGPSEFNHPEDNSHMPFGYINDVVFVQRAWIQEHMLYTVRITSGYRCPHINATIPGAAANSRHMYGDALDMTPPLDRYSPPNESEFNQLRAVAADTSPRYLTVWSTYSDRHLHADWGT